MSSPSAVADTVDFSIYIIESLADEPITLTCDRSQLDGCSIADAAFAVYKQNSEQGSDHFQCFVHRDDLKETDKIPNDIQSLTVIIPTVQPLRGLMERYRKYERTHFKILARLVDDKVCSDKDDCVESFMKYREDTLQRPSAADFKQLLDMQMDMKNRMDKAEATEKELRKEAEATEKKLRKEAEATEKKLRKEAEATEKKLRKELDKVNSRLNLVIKESEATEKKLDDALKKQVATSTRENMSLSARLSASETERVREENVALNRRIEALEGSNEELKALDRARQGAVQHLQGRVHRLELDVSDLTDALVPIRKRILVDAVRFKVMDAILGPVAAQQTSWYDFIKTEQLLGADTYDMKNHSKVYALLTAKYIRFPLTADDIEKVHGDDLRKDGNYVAHNATRNQLMMILENEPEQGEKAQWERLLDYSGI